MIRAATVSRGSVVGWRALLAALATAAPAVVATTPAGDSQSREGLERALQAACVSTAMPLCHWPCSCYPNHALGQVNDWMGEIYERWVAAHGILILTPVYWYGAPGGLKVMIDRLVCADGGNPDPTSTGGKDPGAKALELAGWPYPRHLAGRGFAVVVHGDAKGWTASAGASRTG